MATDSPLQTAGPDIVDADGQRVLLRGTCLGGALNMENFANGFPATETLSRAAMREAMGEEAYASFFERMLDVYFADEDAALLASLGLNCLRIPIHYRHFEDDDRPFELKEEGFRLLDRVIERCARHGIWSIIDLHALPGHQNQMWHCDNPTHWASFWEHSHFQDRVVNLWQELARRYKGNPWVAGYNPINEPADPEETRVAAFYSRLHEAVREIDPDHILFFDGNRYSVDFHMFERDWPNTVWTAHDYALPGFVDGGGYPGVSRGEFVDKKVLEETFLRRTEFMRESNSPIWIGEFGPVYTGDPARDEVRYEVLRDQLEIYERYQAGWVIWLYKDVGLQGLVSLDPDSPYMRRIAAVMEKKARLGVDAWGSVDAGIREIMQPIEDTFEREFPDYQPFPFGRQSWIETLVRHILLAEPLVGEFGASFAGVGAVEAAEIADSFRLENCRRRTPLLEILESAAKAPATTAGQD